jgi:uncharacterized delta-60 repeat protein
VTNPTDQAGNAAPIFERIGGITTTNISGRDVGSSVAVQPDGRIVVAGSSSGSLLEGFFSLARYNSDGSLDITFNEDGKVTTDVGVSEFGSSVVIQPDGKIVVAGQSGYFKNDFALVRYNPDGSLDRTFNEDGKVTTNLGDNAGVQSIAIQADGKIVVAGRIGNRDNGDFALVRYNPDGSLDATLDGDGKVTTDVGANDHVSSVVIQSDGKIVVTGSSHDGIDGGFALVRYNPDGSLDTTFSEGALTPNGTVTTDFRGSVGGGSATIQPDGKILVAGTSYIESNFSDFTSSFALARYNSDGSLDATFNENGVLTTSFLSGYLNQEGGESVAIQPDGKIVVAGYSNRDITVGDVDIDFALARYNPDGSLDTTFNEDGKVITDLGFPAIGKSVAIQPDGKIVVSGYTTSETGASHDFALVRYDKDGSLDETFNPAWVTTQKSRTPVIMGDGISVYDPELSALNNYSGATLSLSRSGGASPQDVFSGAGIVAKQTSGDVVVGDSSPIGTYTYDAGVLTLTFNAFATESLVNEVVQSLAYRNDSYFPPASVQIDWTFNDGNVGDQGTGGARSVTTSTVVNIIDQLRFGPRQCCMSCPWLL